MALFEFGDYAIIYGLVEGDDDTHKNYQKLISFLNYGP